MSVAPPVNSGSCQPVRHSQSSATVSETSISNAEFQRVQDENEKLLRENRQQGVAIQHLQGDNRKLQGDIQQLTSAVRAKLVELQSVSNIDALHAEMDRLLGTLPVSAHSATPEFVSEGDTISAITPAHAIDELGPSAASPPQVCLDTHTESFFRDGLSDILEAHPTRLHRFQFATLLRRTESDLLRVFNGDASAASRVYNALQVRKARMHAECKGGT
jgi:TolA-binding protein